MTKLLRLDLKNFKSFKKAAIPFAEGFTTIAGANGSGKSNILDALLFVLGITSMKMLRADRITELVNHEAEDETARVSLTLKDDKRQEFEISRSIDRQGKSVCRLQQKRCGLNEIASFLNEVGIKPTGYNIVVQGDITRIIQMSPKERRGIIDEAAGIKEFDEKREEALRELEKVDGKIKEVRIVLNEREQFLKELDEDRKAASRHIEASKELRQAKASVLRLEAGEVEAEISRIEGKEAGIAQELEQITGERNSASQKMKEMGEKLEELNNALIRAGESAFEGIARSLEEKKAEFRIAEEKEKTLKEIELAERERSARLEKARQALEERKSKAESSLSRVLQELKDAESALKGTEAGKALERLHESIKKHAATESELKALNQALKEVKKAIAKCPVCDSRLPEKRKKEIIEAREKQLESLNKSLKELEALVLKEREKAKNSEQEMEKKHKLSGEKNTLEAEAKSIFERIEELEREKTEAEKKRIEADEKSVLEKNRMGELKNELKELELEEKKFSEKNKRLMQEKEILKAKIGETAEKKQKLEEGLRKQEQALNQAAIEKSKNSVRLADLQEELKEFESEKILENASLAGLRKRIIELEKEISSLGAVNLKALESFEHLESEVREVRGKAGKLEEERIAVLNLIEKIEVRRLDVFANCFRKVSENFNRIYFEFFEGSGSLKLTGEKNPFEAGLIIEARHKSEKALPIDLMSGGEKTLAALAFLFAIQFYEPSPFYVFDEADAALDMENSIKFARMVKQISKESQFIAITHNDVVIKQADQLIGVALNKQKSSVIGLNLSKASQAGG